MTSSFYAMLPGDVRLDNSLTPGTRLLYAELSAMCIEGSFCSPTNAELAERFNIDVRSVQRCLQALAEKQYISMALLPEERVITLNRVTILSPVEKPVQGDKDDIATVELFPTPFEYFWENWPRKEKKKDAKRAFEKAAKLHGFPSIEEMTGIVAAWKKTNQWVKDDGDFIPLASSWLNGERWNDELPSGESEDNRVRRLMDESAR